METIINFFHTEKKARDFTSNKEFVLNHDIS